jgi:RNA polymerase sigma factor (sigma-70 family)
VSRPIISENIISEKMINGEEIIDCMDNARALAHRLSRRFGRPDYYHEFCSVGYLAIVEAAHRFRPMPGRDGGTIPFYQYATRCARSAIYNFHLRPNLIRGVSREDAARAVKLKNGEGHREYRGRTIEWVDLETILDLTSEGQALDHQVLIHEGLDTLDGLKRRIMILFYLWGMTCVEIGERIRMDWTAVQSQKYMAIQKLKKFRVVTKDRKSNAGIEPRRAQAFKRGIYERT